MQQYLTHLKKIATMTSTKGECSVFLPPNFTYNSFATKHF
jgi:hypothetical protein